MRGIGRAADASQPFLSGHKRGAPRAPPSARDTLIHTWPAQIVTYCIPTLSTPSLC